jgi:hypothetical protein
MSRQTDLDFLREIKTRLSDGWERNDITQIEMVHKMIDDWIDKLEGEIQSTKREIPEVEDGGEIEPYQYGSMKAPIYNGL